MHTTGAPEHRAVLNFRLHTAVLILALLLCGVFSTPASARTGYAKVMNMFLSNTVDAEALEILSRFDILTLSADFEFDNPTAIAQLRAMNPDIVLLAYIPINGTDPAGGALDPNRINYHYWSGVDDGDFWLYSVDGSPASDWPGKWTTNLTPHSPANSQGQVYWEWFAEFVYQEVWKQGNSNWDGIFLDDVWGAVSWMNAILHSPIDSDRDGNPEDTDQLNTWWRDTNDLCTARIRDLVGPDVPIMGNGSNPFFTSLNGTMAENFPFNGAAEQGNIYGYAWTRWMFTKDGAYLSGLDNFNSSPMSLMTINAAGDGNELEPDRSARFNQHKRFCLGSVLLGDGYFSLDFAWDQHASLWWEPEYDIYLGQPLTDYYSLDNNGVTVWRRDYEAAVVVVNPNNATSQATAEMPQINPWDAYIGPRLDTIDQTPPDALDDLSATVLDATRVRLVWSAPADQGPAGRAGSYQVRYSTEPIGLGPSWVSAFQVPNALAPKAPGSVEMFEVTGLLPRNAYYFAVRSLDASGNLSGVGNTPMVTMEAADQGPPSLDGVKRVGDPFPNPTQGAVRFEIEVDSGTEVLVEVFDVRGRKLGELPAQYLGAGEHEILWESAASSLEGRGLYFLRVRIGAEVWTKKLHLLD